LDYEVGFDSLVMYKNSVAGANRLGQFSGSTLPMAGAWNTISGNALWFIQYSDQLHTTFFRLGLRLQCGYRQAGRSQHAGTAELTA
jgi:hypothetical protein